ncbi:hypothetical protein ACQP3J_33505, partial [Escherichia coli]
LDIHMKPELPLTKFHEPIQNEVNLNVRPKSKTKRNKTERSISIIGINIFFFWQRTQKLKE